MKNCPDGFMEVPDQKTYHSAKIFFLSKAFGNSPVWVEKDWLTIRPGEKWIDAFKRQFGKNPDKREKAFVPKGLY